MSSLKTYLLSILGVAIICSLVNRFAGGKSSRAFIHMLTGIVMLLCSIGPLVRMDISFDDVLFRDVRNEVMAAVEDGEAESREALSDVIKQKTATYIIQKARSLNADISVEVYLTDEQIPVPYAVLIQGQIAPYARKQLTSILENDLGISKENQIWT